MQTIAVAKAKIKSTFVCHGDIGLQPPKTLTLCHHRPRINADIVASHVFMSAGGKPIMDSALKVQFSACNVNWGTSPNQFKLTLRGSYT
jgi:hypothetical protein